VPAVRTGLAFEKGEPPVALLPGSENPHRHEDNPENPKVKRSAKATAWQSLSLLAASRKRGRGTGEVR
jgi:hypothetical protein